MKHSKDEIIRAALAETPDLLEHYDTRTSQPAASTAAAIEAVDFDELAAGDMTHGYLIKGVLGRGSYANMFGAPGEGKTFVALDMALAIAQGRPWRERKVQGGLVLYIAYEGGGGLVKRAIALKKQYGSAPRMKVITENLPNLRELAGRHALRDLLAKLPEQPVLIAIDTFAQALMGADENSAADVGVFNTAIKALRESTGATVLLIHHSGKDKSKGARGSTALLGAIDTEIQIDGNTVISRKQRDDDLAPEIGFKLKPVAVGVDSDGDTVFSCVVEAGTAQPTAWKPKGQTAALWKVFCELDGGTRREVTADALRPAFAAVDDPAKDKSATANKKAVNRALAQLLKQGWIEGEQGGPWRRALKGGSEYAAPGATVH